MHTALEKVPDEFQSYFIFRIIGDVGKSLKYMELLSSSIKSCTVLNYFKSLSAYKNIMWY